MNYLRKTTASSTATTFNAHTIWFRINVLSGTNSICKDVLFCENVLYGTKREFHTARDAPAVCREMSRSDRGVRHREVRSWHGKKAVVRENHSLFFRASEGTRTHTH